MSPISAERGFGRLLLSPSAKTSDPVVVLMPPKLDEMPSIRRLRPELQAQDDGRIEVTRCERIESRGSHRSSFREMSSPPWQNGFGHLIETARSAL